MLQFARGTLMISDILCYFHTASFLGSILQLFPAQLEFQAFSVNCTETVFRIISKYFKKIISKVSLTKYFAAS